MFRQCIKIWSQEPKADSMYYDMEPTQCIKMGNARVKIGGRLNVLRYGAESRVNVLG